GGTNVHAVLEEAPLRDVSSPATAVNLLTFSAKSPTALAETSQRVAAYLLANPDVNLSDAAWTLQIGRKPFPFRKSLAINSDFYQNPAAILEDLAETGITEVKPEKQAVYFLFSGQGSQYQGMGRDLYAGAEDDAVAKLFKQHIDQVFDFLEPKERNTFLQLMYGQTDPQKINQTQYTQLAMFATSYALAKTMLALGVSPDGMVGHSIGEVTAATVAGVFALEDAVAIVRLRGQLMQKQATGAMLAIMAPVATVENLLQPNIWLSLENSTNNCVVGGTETAIVAFEEKLKQLQIKCTRVRTSHAFHTPMMAEAASELAKAIAQYRLNEPTIPLVSNISGRWVQAQEMSTPAYWASHILQPVHFTESLAEIMQAEQSVFIEVGAGRTLITFARQHADKKAGQQFINLIRHPREEVNDVAYAYKKIGKLWCSGVALDWSVLQGEAIRQRVSLPTYVFDKVHFPIEVQLGGQVQAASASKMLAEPLLPTVQMAVFESQSELELVVINAYKTILGYDEIGRKQDFFSLGGDSLKAVSLASVMTEQLGVKVEVTDLFKYPSAQKLAAFLKDNALLQHQLNDPLLIHPAANKDEYPLSSAQVRMYALHMLDRDNLAYNLPSATIIKGKLDKKRLEKALEKLVQRHESLRTSFGLWQNQPVQIIHDTG
ncbi:MAG TPA: acyltransferase domain-containing protein, partial [Anaerolineae bacterium]|nr:acyltransferase domain-containing protein [Anaerolineae bacterium]